MTRIQEQSNDGRREQRRPSLLFVLSLLGCALLGGLLVWMAQVWPGVKVVEEQKTDGLNNKVGESGLLMKRADALPSVSLAEKRVELARYDDPLADQLTRLLWNIRHETDPTVREELMAAFVKHLPAADISAMLDRLQGCNDPMELKLATCLLRQWASEDGRSAAAWAEQLPVGPLRQEALNAVSVEWANVDLQGAVQWAANLSDARERDLATRAVAGEAVRMEPVTALNLAAELPPSRARDELMDRGCMEWAMESGEAAVEWAQQITPESYRQELLSHVLVGWSEADPASAARMAVTLLQGRFQSDAIMGIVNRWVQVEPDAVVQWVESFPEGLLKETAMESMASILVVQETSDEAQ